MEGWGADLRKENVGKHGNRKKQKCYNAGTDKIKCAGSGPFPALGTGRICTCAEDKHWCQIYCNKSTILDI